MSGTGPRVLVVDDEPGIRRFLRVSLGARGYSVREVIDSAVRVTGQEIPVELATRRAGDPPELWANADRLRSELGWSPRFTRLDDIIATAWTWFREHPHGYGDCEARNVQA